MPASQFMPHRLPSAYPYQNKERGIKRKYLILLGAP